MFVIAGATGHTGKAAAEALLAKNKEVMVIVRSEEKGAPWLAKGAKVGVTELEDSEKLAGFLARAEGAYLLVPPNFSNPDYLGNQRKVAESLAKAVSESMIPHVVLLSSIGGQLSSGTGLIVVTHYAETELKPVAKNLTILRAPFFLENWEMGLGAARKDEVLPSFLIANRKIPMIATRDIGRAAANALLDPPVGQRIIELAGPSEYSPTDIANAASAVLKRNVTVQELPPDAAVTAFSKMGIPAQAARLAAEMYAGINSGYISYENAATVQRESTTELELLRQLLAGNKTQSAAL